MLQIPDRKRYIATETLGAIIGAAGAVGGATINGVASGKMNRRAEKFNREEAAAQRAWSEEQTAKQNAWNYQMWKEATEYDSPVKQVERLREAGLNPMYYGLDGNASQSAPDAAQPLGYERAQAPNYVNPFGSAIDAAVKVAQIGNIQADTAKKGQETQSEVAHREKMQAEIENIKQENNNLKAQEGLTKSQKEQIDKNNQWLDRINEAVIAEKESQTKLNNSQRNRIDELLEGEKILQVRTAQDFEEKWKKIRAEIGKISKETGVLELDLENYALNHANNGFMGTGLSLNNLFRLRFSDKPVKGAPNYADENTNPMDLAREGQ